MTKQTREELEKKARKFYDKYTTTLSILIIATMFFGLWYFFIIKDYKDIQKENSALKEKISEDAVCQIKICDFYVNEINQPYPCLIITNGFDEDKIDTRFYTLKEQQGFVGQIGWKLENCEVLPNG